MTSQNMIPFILALVHLKKIPFQHRHTVSFRFAMNRRVLLASHSGVRGKARGGGEGVPASVP